MRVVVSCVVYNDLHWEANFSCRTGLFHVKRPRAAAALRFELKNAGMLPSPISFRSGVKMITVDICVTIAAVKQDDLVRENVQFLFRLKAQPFYNDRLHFVLIA